MTTATRWITSLSVGIAALAFAACTNEADLGDHRTPSEPSGTAADAAVADPATNESEDSAPADGGVGQYGATGSGESCDPAKFYPPKSTTCTIAGSYAVTEESCSGGACGPYDPFTWQGTVTVNGTQVKFRGQDTLYECELTGACDCATSSGKLIRFTKDGFFEIGTIDCGNGNKASYLAKGERL